ncbi:MAG: hypothetical protein KGI98_07680 [Euryarchaeota archaeon]|nr:hypothetical protein [Euryarchaeota archaeon]MDE2046530.1 hypothetical protein [Thermoplasmata archaeon]
MAPGTGPASPHVHDPPWAAHENAHRAPGEAPVEAASELQELIRRDRDEVLVPLLRSFHTLSQILGKDIRVAPEVIAEGLALLDSYHEHLHVPRIRQLARFFDASAPPATWNLVGLLQGEHERGPRRIVATRAFLSNYEAGLPRSSQQLSRELAQLIRAELSWQGTKEGLAARLPRTGAIGPPNVQQSLQTALDRAPSQRAKERTALVSYLKALRGAVRSSLEGGGVSGRPSARV